jgi:hypothetical protein
MSQEETRAGGRCAPQGPGDSLGLGALYLEQQGLKRFAGAKVSPGTPRR